MKAFADLYTALDETNKTNEKVEALVQYFQRASDADAAWALFFLSGRRLKQLISAPKLRSWAVEASGLPEWLFAESYDSVGDSAETIALLLQRSADSLSGWQPYGEPTAPETHTESLQSEPDLSDTDSAPLRDWIENRIIPLKKVSDEDQRGEILKSWRELDGSERFVYNKLLTGGFRVGVSQLLLIRGLSAVMDVHTEVIAHRMMGEWSPTPEFYRSLAVGETTDADASRPYPFFLAFPVEGTIEEVAGTLGEVADYQAEWKWDGIRAQIIQRGGVVSIWSRGEELITERFPELAELGAKLPDGTVIDGEILPWHFAEQPTDGIGRVMPFAQLQRRIGRKTLGKKILSEVPVVFMAYDYLESSGIDQRELPVTSRRAMLEELADRISDPSLITSPIVEAESWETMFAQRDAGRALNVEGLMLKRRSSPYRVGRIRGDWWKWKVNPYTVDAVLIYAQRGTGKRASLYTDYTFAVWQDGQLVPFAKAYSGLTDAEIREVDAYVRRNTLEKFGPVRTVKAEQVFELAFEGIQLSSRHKSGIAVRFPRILRWRKDKPASEADSIETIRALLTPETGTIENAAQ